MSKKQEKCLKNKLVEGIDNNVWNRFAGYCKANNVKIGQKISEILDIFLKQQNKSR